MRERSVSHIYDVIDDRPSVKRGSAPGVASLLACCFLFLVSASAQAQEWTVDMDASEFSFTVRHIGFFEVEGVFRQGSGALVFASATPDSSTTASVSPMIVAAMELDVASVDTDNSLRDRELVSEDFLDARRYPSISFTSTSVAADSLTPNEYLLTGVMNIYGTSREITIPIILNHDVGEGTVTVTSEFVVHRHDYEMDFGRASDGLIGKEVSVHVSIVAREVPGNGNRP